MTDIQTTFFTCVNAGYSNQTSTDHTRALETVKKALSFAKRSGSSDKNHYNVSSTFMVYDPALGCLDGGEIAVAVTTDGKLSSVAKTAEKLREQLEQSSLSVSGAPENKFATTKGLKIKTKGDFAKIAKIWQDEATKIKDSTVTSDNPYGVYISAGVCDLGNGDILIQGEANPRYFPTDESKRVWEEAARKVIDSVGAQLDQKLEPEFRDMGFIYLRAKDKVNSRGELD